MNRENYLYYFYETTKSLSTLQTCPANLMVSVS